MRSVSAMIVGMPKEARLSGQLLISRAGHVRTKTQFSDYRVYQDFAVFSSIIRGITTSGVRPDRAQGAHEHEAKEHDLPLVRQRRA